MKELTTKKLLLGGLVVLFALHPVQVEPVTWVTEHRKSWCWNPISRHHLEKLQCSDDRWVQRESSIVVM